LSCIRDNYLVYERYATGTRRPDDRAAPPGAPEVRAVPDPDRALPRSGVARARAAAVRTAADPRGVVADRAWRVPATARSTARARRRRHAARLRERVPPSRVPPGR